MEPKGIEISELNYETFALDYAEGRLTGETLASMEAFLERHPDLREELAAIAGTSIPFEHAVLEDKSFLYRSEEGVLQPSAAPFFTWGRTAAAAVILLAAGLFFTFSGQMQYGELAADRPAFTIHYSLEHIYRIQPRGASEVQEPASGTELQRPAQVPALIGEAEADGLRRNSNIGSRQPAAARSVTDDDLQGSSVENASIGSATGAGTGNAVPFRTKLRIIDPAVVPEDEYYVLPVTIELHDLSESTGREARQEIDELTTLEDIRNARRKRIKDGTLSLLQDSFMPQGLSNLFSN